MDNLHAARAASWFPASVLVGLRHHRSYPLRRMVGSLPQRLGWNVAWGINDLNDIVGVSSDADGNSFAARWNTKDSNFVQVLGFPGTSSIALKVNDQGMAIGAYASDTIQEDVVAMQIP